MSTALASRIHEVTVFRSGARVLRVAEIPDDTERLVRLVRLPLTLDDGSIRARVEGQGAATDLRVTMEVPPPNAALAPPRDEELVAAQFEVARIRAEVERVNAMISRIQSIAVLARPPGKEGEPPAPSPTASRLALLAFRTEEQARLAEELLGLERALVIADRHNASLRDRALRATTEKNPKEHELWKSVVVTLDAAARGLLHVEYMVPGARWSPSYSIGFGGSTAGSSSTSSNKDAELSLRAAVAQKTGEDWAGAKLVLSTADADRWTELPVLKSVRIGRAQQGSAPRGWREPPMGAAELYADYDRGFGAPRPGREMADALSRSIGEDDVTVSVAYEGYDEENTKVDAAFGAGSSDGAIRTIATMPVPRSPKRAPSPPMSAPPAAYGAPPAMAGGFVGASASIPMPSSAATPRGGMLAAARATTMAPMKRRAAHAMRDDAPSAPVASGLDLEALAYGRMRMPGPNAAGRGALVAASAASLYVESLGAAISVDVLALVRVAVRQSAIRDDALPPGHEPLPHSNDFDYAYLAKGPCTVPSDGAFRVLPLGTFGTEARVRHVAVPRETQDVFRVLELTSPIDAALLCGPVDVYQAGAYVLTTRLPPTPPRGNIRLGLGVDQAIKIARNTTYAEKATGLLGGSLSLVHEIDVDISNGTDRKVELEVRERVPVTAQDDKDVEVSVDTVEPAWKAWTQEQTLDGGFKWELTIEPRQKRKLYAKYTLKLSGKQEIIGGNRREG